MSIIFDITHTTHYRYAQPVTLGEHRVLFRPRDSHDLRVLATDMVITPLQQEVRLIQDVYFNSVALVQPQSPASELKVVCTFSVEHTGTPAVDFPLNPRAQNFPFEYEEEERLVLAHYLRPYYDDLDGQLRTWANQFTREQQVTGTRELLIAMTKFIRDTMQYKVRYEEGVQTPVETLRLQSGTCRDFATLMIESIRHLGYAARFISGYLYTPSLDGDIEVSSSSGSTHAWLEVYLPCAFSGGECDVLLRADDIVHDDDAPVKAEIIRKAFRGAEFLYTLRLGSGDMVMAHVPSHHDHKIGEWIGIRAEVAHVVTFDRESSVSKGKLCRMPCENAPRPTYIGTLPQPVSLLATLPHASTVQGTSNTPNARRSHP